MLPLIIMFREQTAPFQGVVSSFVFSHRAKREYIHVHPPPPPIKAPVTALIPNKIPSLITPSKLFSLMAFSLNT